MPVSSLSQIKPGLYVSIVLKADQRSGRQVQGRVAQTLTRHNHPRGIKVKLTDGRVGRVQQILDENQNNRPRNAMSSNNNPWADSVSQGQSQGYQPQQSQQNSQPPMSYAAYQLAQNAQENPWGGQDQSQGYNNYNPPQQSSFGYNAPQGAPPTQPIRRSDTEQLLAQQTDRAEQVEHMQQYESATPMSEDDRNQADLQRQFPNIDSSLIAAIYNERKPDMAEVRELLQELNTS
ncbi:hypothetical protein PV10_05890 [Exophiala mesophila]|uniref:Uncharacterized protein n=1 Tax=Exophiala mesophila TaxID=212818 RepID=A0A0D1ZBJ4_EXOME|nr:uncharacterized protein PV10_05890 [Exophiala mesophila]KIV91344.1 hypothetical protein PV10_05890 [Exophiala mesophila]